MADRFVYIEGDVSDDPTGDFAYSGAGAVYDTETDEVYPFGPDAETVTHEFNREPEWAHFYAARPATALEREQVEALQASADEEAAS
jgi:hypothetical protein